jgi:hypothetical protein
MDYQQKTAALFALGGDPSIRFRKIGDWYVNQDVSVRDRDVMIGRFGNGVTPQEAIEEHWKELVESLEPHQYLVVRQHGERRAVRWNGFMWTDVDE